jgi:hypothetical protein
MEHSDLVEFHCWHSEVMQSTPLTVVVVVVVVEPSSLVVSDDDVDELDRNGHFMLGLA